MAAARSPVFRRLLQGLIVGLAGALLALLLTASGLLDVFEFKTWDARQQTFARPSAATDQIVLILLDQPSLDWCKDNNAWYFPWPRVSQQAITDFCRKAGAKSLNFDIIYSEPSWYGVSDDEDFHQAMTENGRVVGTLALGSDGMSTKTWPADVRDEGIAIAGFNEWLQSAQPKTINFPMATFPTPDLVGAFSRLANTYPNQDADGVYRRLTLFYTFGGRIIPSHALAAYLTGNPGKHSLSIKPGVLTVDTIEIPIDSEGRAILRFRGPSKTHPNFSAAAIIQTEAQSAENLPLNIDHAKLKNKYVFFGYSAPGLADVKQSAMLGQYPGVELHATELDNLLAGDFMRPAPWWAQALILIIVCAAAAVIVSGVSKAWRSALIYIAFLPVIPALGFAAFPAGFWLPIVPGTFGVALSLIGASLASFATEGRQKRFLKSAFKQYLSPVFIEQIISHPERLKLGGEKRELSIYFSDLQGFTTISEMLTPEDLTTLLNEYLSAMADIIQDSGGTIDKYEGDAIIAFWNAPLDLPDHAVRALRASLQCQATLAQMRPGFRERVKNDLFMRIGINSGAAIVGNMGSRTHFNYTMLGDAVNLAARLEGINKQFGTYTMVSGATMALAGNAFPARELSRVAVKGKTIPVTVYEPMLPEEYASRKPALTVFDRGLKAFYAGQFKEAIAIFQETAAVDPPSAAYLEKCRALMAQPPEDGWNGVWVMTSK
jgi:adenylate cyclase